MLIKKVKTGTSSRLPIVDHNESYGRHILEKIMTKSMPIQHCLDLGCGEGADLEIIKKQHPDADCYGVDFGDWNAERLKEKNINPIVVNIEADPLPFEDESLDFIIGNQIMEHVKEIYWINHEVFRSLKVGGYFFMGVPNLLSFHNRILGLFGGHPTTAKMISAHIRSYSKKDTYLYYNTIAKQMLHIDGYYGSQFYPFPKLISRPLSKALPTLALSNFYLIKKTAAYQGEFINWLSETVLETNYYRGPNPQ